MKIMYISKAYGHDNDDEGAIADAFIKLGHTVTHIDQSTTERHPNKIARISADYDFCLYHKFDDLSTLINIKCPKVFWYFDLVDSHELSMATRDRGHITRLIALTKYSDVGFCTDGEWVARDTTDKLVWLMQGADQRLINTDLISTHGYKNIDILFVGGEYGTRRREWVNMMKDKYGNRLVVIPSRPHYSQRIHGDTLRHIINTSKVVVAPDAPFFEKYWSNRVYLLSGLGAFIIHPYSKYLAEQYKEKEEIEFYSTREEMFSLIEAYTKDHNDIVRSRYTTSFWGTSRTQKEHTYVHRVSDIISILISRGIVKAEVPVNTEVTTNVST